MIRFFIENKERSITDILYGVQEEQNDLYSVEFLTKEKAQPTDQDMHVLTEPKTFFVRDQTPLTDPTAGLVSYDKRNSIMLFNKIPVTADEYLSFYENITVINGAWVAIGHEAGRFLREHNEKHDHIVTAIEELDHVIYPGSYATNYPSKPKVFLDGRHAQVFGQYLDRLAHSMGADAAEAEAGVEPLPFETTDDINDCDIYLTFEDPSREVLRMIDGRVKTIYVPSEPKTWVFDPRSMFRCSRHLIEMTKQNNMTDHQIAAQFRALFEDMVQYISDVHTKEAKVNYMKLTGSVPLFQALFYNLSRTV